MALLPPGGAANVRLLRICAHQADAVTVGAALDEVARASQVRCPELLAPVAWEAPEGLLWTAYPYMDGVPLSILLAQAIETGTTLPITVSARMLLDVCSALAVLHRNVDTNGAVQPLVHGGLTLESLWVGMDGLTYVADAGFARARALLGGIPADMGVDVLAAGHLMYQLFTGQPVPAGATGPLDIRAVTADVPASVANVVQRATHANPTLRPSNAMVLAVSLESALRPLGGPALHTELRAWLGRLFPEDHPLRNAQRQALGDYGVLAPRTSSPGLAPVTDGTGQRALTANEVLSLGLPPDATELSSPGAQAPIGAPRDVSGIQPLLPRAPARTIPQFAAAPAATGQPAPGPAGFEPVSLSTALGNQVDITDLSNPRQAPAPDSGGFFQDATTRAPPAPDLLAQSAVATRPVDQAPPAAGGFFQDATTRAPPAPDLLAQSAAETRAVTGRSGSDLEGFGHLPTRPHPISPPREALPTNLGMKAPSAQPPPPPAPSAPSHPVQTAMPAAAPADAPLRPAMAAPAAPPPRPAMDAIPGASWPNLDPVDLSEPVPQVSVPWGAPVPPASQGGSTLSDLDFPSDIPSPSGIRTEVLVRKRSGGGRVLLGLFVLLLVVTAGAGVAVWQVPELRQMVLDEPTVGPLLADLLPGNKAALEDPAPVADPEPADPQSASGVSTAASAEANAASGTPPSDSAAAPAASGTLPGAASGGEPASASAAGTEAAASGPVTPPAKETRAQRRARLKAERAEKKRQLLEQKQAARLARKEALRVRREARLAKIKAATVGTLSLEVPDGTLVWVDGRKKGATPLPPMELKKGRHKVLVINRAQKVKRIGKVTIKPSNDTVFKAMPKAR